MPVKRKIRVVLDANWFVSACISSNSRRTVYYSILRNVRLRTYYSNELAGEFRGVMSRKKFAKKIAPAQVNRFFTLAQVLMKRVVPVLIPATSRDPDDDYLLGICKACQANFLITGDDDLLTLGTFESTTILTMGQFLHILPLL
jgi:putative PIN family toxin of toxin-antitoxin system